ncbi:MAG TPA: UPF0058 family protein [Methanocorpusculum sp.]|nr:UPF0058 family protein [Methanocorpusculum sp.]
MQKEELLHIHMLLVQIKKYYEHINHSVIATGEYDALAISPMHIHKNKNIHRVAVMTLGNEIVSTMRASMGATTVASEKQQEAVPVEH